MDGLILLLKVLTDNPNWLILEILLVILILRRAVFKEGLVLLPMITLILGLNRLEVIVKLQPKIEL